MKNMLTLLTVSIASVLALVSCNGNDTAFTLGVENRTGTRIEITATASPGTRLEETVTSTVEAGVSAELEFCTRVEGAIKLNISYAGTVYSGVVPYVDQSISALELTVSESSGTIACTCSQTDLFATYKDKEITLTAL